MTKKANCERDCHYYKTCECGSIDDRNGGYNPSAMMCTAGPKCTDKQYHELMIDWFAGKFIERQTKHVKACREVFEKGKNQWSEKTIEWELRHYDFLERDIEDHRKYISENYTDEEYQERIKNLEEVESLVVEVDTSKFIKRSASDILKDMFKRWKTKKYTE